MQALIDLIVNGDRQFFRHRSLSRIRIRYV
jgi:hypothetical protein